MNFLHAIYSKIDLFDLLSSGAIVITPNNRLSHALLGDFAKLSSHHVQEKPKCFSYPTFLRQAFQMHCHRYPWDDHPILLTPQQCRFSWHKILLNAYEQVNTSLCDAIHEAWTSCHLWCVNLKDTAFLSTDQTALFQTVALRFQETLNQHSAITEAQVACYLSNDVNFRPADKIVWVCFDDFSPQQQKLQTLLSERNVEQYCYELNCTSASHLRVFQHQAKNDEEELTHLIHWLNNRLALNEKRIAVVVPDLEARYSSLKRRLSQAFAPNQWNISLGQALADYPLVAHALSWVRLNPSTLAKSEARLLLHSPYLIAAETEYLARAQYLENTSILNGHSMDMSRFIQTISPRAPRLAAALNHLESYPDHASLDIWIEVVYKRLSDLGFPGNASLNSESYQVYQRFLTLLDEWMELTLIQTTFSQEEALSSLETLAQTTLFQPKKPHHPTLQILGLLEASGCEFDSLWVMHLTEQQLPKASRLSPFIPPALQRHLQMPHATPEREMHLAEIILTRLSRASEYTVFSYSRLSGEQLNRPSPLITHLPLLDNTNHRNDPKHLDPLAFHEDYSYQIYQEQKTSTTKVDHSDPSEKILSHAFEHYEEHYLIPLQSEEKSGGGTRVLATQAQCPFKAFAAHRLHAQPLPSSTEVPSAKERGQWIHRIMEQVWRQLTNQKSLLALSETALKDLVRAITEETLSTYLEDSSFSMTTLMREVEQERLESLVHLTLAWEKKRPPFTVEAIEASFSLNLAGFDLKLRIDRLDRFEEPNQSKGIIDYKTQMPTVLPWNDARPTEPQLLLYSLIDKEITALLFAQLNKGQFICKGISHQNTNIPGVKSLKTPDDWAEQRETWQQELNALATEYLNGHCPPKPKNKTICQNCDYRNLCRVDYVNT